MTDRALFPVVNTFVEYEKLAEDKFYVKTGNINESKHSFLTHILGEMNSSQLTDLLKTLRDAEMP